MHQASLVLYCLDGEKVVGIDNTSVWEVKLEVHYKITKSPLSREAVRDETT